MVEIGGLVVYAFQTVFGNPDVMAIIISWSMLLVFLFSGIEIYRRSKG